MPRARCLPACTSDVPLDRPGPAAHTPPLLSIPPTAPLPSRSCARRRSPLARPASPHLPVNNAPVGSPAGLAPHTSKRHLRRPPPWPPVFSPPALQTTHEYTSGSDTPPPSGSIRTQLDPAPNPATLPNCVPPLSVQSPVLQQAIPAPSA